jgi:hypothetical protein
VSYSIIWFNAIISSATSATKKILEFGKRISKIFKANFISATGATKFVAAVAEKFIELHHIHKKLGQF